MSRSEDHGKGPDKDSRQDISDIQSASVGIPAWRLLADLSSELLGLLDGQGHLLYLNGAGRLLLGVPEGAGEQHGMAEAAAQIAGLSARLQPGPDGDRSTLRHIGTGAEIPVRIQLKPVPDSAGALAISARDLRPELEAEESVRQIEQRLQAALGEQVARHTAELSKANYQLQDLNSFLQQSNAELEQYAYVASHDLQEPLRKISVFAGMLSRMEGMPGEAGVAIEKINQASARMTQLIRDLLEFSRLLKAERRMRPVDLNVVLQSVLTDFELQISEKGATIVADPLPTIEAVSLQMNQLFHNLISNAMKFVREGIPPRIEIRCRVLDKGEHADHGLEDSRIVHYYITVADNGIGFDSRYSEQIFEVFKRLHTQQSYPGSGIGLALCRRILQNHGGIMTAQSQEGTGTTIAMILPSGPSAT